MRGYIGTSTGNWRSPTQKKTLVEGESWPTCIWAIRIRFSPIFITLKWSWLPTDLRKMLQKARDSSNTRTLMRVDSYSDVELLNSKSESSKLSRLSKWPGQITWNSLMRTASEFSVFFAGTHQDVSQCITRECGGVFVGSDPTNSVTASSWQWTKGSIPTIPKCGVDSFAAINGSWRSARRDRSFGRKLPHDTPRLCTFSCPPVMPGSTAGKKTRPKFGMELL